MKKFKTKADLDYACRQLAAQDAQLAHVYETYGAPPMRQQPMAGRFIDKLKKAARLDPVKKDIVLDSGEEVVMYPV